MLVALWKEEAPKAELEELFRRDPEVAEVLKDIYVPFKRRPDVVEIGKRLEEILESIQEEEKEEEEKKI